MTDQAKEKRRKPKPYGAGRAYKRGARWWIEFWHNGRPYRMPTEHAETEREAWDELAARREEVRQGRRLDAERATFAALTARLRSHHAAKGTRPRTLARYEQHLVHLEGFFARDPVGDVPGRIEAYIAARRKAGAKPATIKGEVDLLAQAFKVARLPRLDRPTIVVSNTRGGFFEQAEVRRVVAHLPAALRGPVLFGYFTGWRKSEILSLGWRNVDLKGGFVRLDPGTTKSGEGRCFPIGAHPDLRELLEEQRAATKALEHGTGQIVPWVFHRGGCQIADMDDAWRTACKAAGVPGRLFHDLRRSAALSLRRLGLSESDIMELCGWETRTMFQRYAIKDERGLAERLQRALTRTTPAQTPKVSSAAHAPGAAEEVE